ncbi:uncharacterized protein [Penaeus vannamei]|uniref:uncharacterized protein n=1 Tax=Penaeus vannamei TaxID=6689 RepID=UPI00387F4B1D
MWRPVLTEHNRCFTFTPDAEGGLTSYAVTLNTDYRGKRRPRENVSHELIHSSLRLGNEPFTLFRLHDRNENLYVLPKDDFYGEINYGSASSTEFSLSLTSVTTISRRGRECVSSARYTREECLSRCRITAVGTAHRCRLPYDTWSHLPTCNGSTYTTYPRPLGKQMASSVIIPGKGPAIPKMKDDCRASCLPACARRSFTARNAVNHLQKKKVVVSFSGKTYDIVREEDSYSWAQWLSDMGGVGGFVLGASLLSLLRALVSTPAAVRPQWGS